MKMGWAAELHRFKFREEKNGFAVVHHIYSAEIHNLYIAVINTVVVNNLYSTVVHDLYSAVICTM